MKEKTVFFCLNTFIANSFLAFFQSLVKRKKTKIDNVILFYNKDTFLEYFYQQ